MYAPLPSKCNSRLAERWAAVCIVVRIVAV
jgi:hypothetical protein